MKETAEVYKVRFFYGKDSHEEIVQTIGGKKSAIGMAKFEASCKKNTTP